MNGLTADIDYVVNLCCGDRCAGDERDPHKTLHVGKNYIVIVCKKKSEFIRI